MRDDYNEPMRSSRLHALWAALVLVAALGAPALAGKTHKAKDAAASLACHADSDCVLVADGCCDCNSGGSQRAIPATAKASYEKKRKAKCHDTACPALMSEDASCQAKAVCKDGSCALGH